MPEEKFVLESVPACRAQKTVSTMATSWIAAERWSPIGCATASDIMKTLLLAGGTGG